MNLLRKLFTKTVAIDPSSLGTLDIENKVVIFKFTDESELDSQTLQALSRFLMSKGAIGLIGHDTTQEISAVDIQALEGIIARAKERLNANPNS